MSYKEKLPDNTWIIQKYRSRRCGIEDVLKVTTSCMQKAMRKPFSNPKLHFVYSKI